jgi:pimeloyl-ACP methyl ester carboxylesterase
MLSQQGIERATILGISLGGYVALAMLRAKPDSVNGIGLIDTKVTADSPAAVRNRQRIASEIKDSLSLSEYAEQMLPTLLSRFTHEHRTEVIDQVRTWISASSASTVAWLQQAMAGRPDSSSVLKRFDGPTLLLRGADDVVSKPEDFQIMLELAKNPTFIELENCGHLPPVEDPQATGDAIAAWLINY